MDDLLFSVPEQQEKGKKKNGTYRKEKVVSAIFDGEPVNKRADHAADAVQHAA